MKRHYISFDCFSIIFFLLIAVFFTACNYVLWTVSLSSESPAKVICSLFIYLFEEFIGRLSINRDWISGE